MNSHSILFRITLIFIISFLALITLFIILRYNEMFHHIKRLQRRQGMALRPLKHVEFQKYIDESKKNSNFLLELLDDKPLIKDLKNNGRLIKVVDFHEFSKRRKRVKLPPPPFPRPKHKNSPPKSITIYKMNNKLYSLVKFNDNKILLFRDMEQIPGFFEIQYIILIFSQIILIIVYVTLIRKLKPLKTLQSKVREFGRGNMDIDCRAKGKDEISNLSNEFHHAMIEIKNLNESRTLFLRNLMHEIHTPITKGKILTELVEEKKTHNQFSKLFTRLELLVQEISQYEALKSGHYQLELASHRIIDMIDNSMEILMLDDYYIEHELQSESLLADFELFTLAIKNIIDNAIKYSPDRKVRISFKDDELQFISRGNELQYPLETYLTPFYKGDDSHKGLGLGLYIVSTILSSHKMYLDYSYSEGLNTFAFKSKEKNRKY